MHTAITLVWKCRAYWLATLQAKRPLFSDRLSESLCLLSVRSTACAIDNVHAMRYRACSVASHVAYRLV